MLSLYTRCSTLLLMIALLAACQGASPKAPGKESGEAKDTIVVIPLGVDAGNDGQPVDSSSEAILARPQVPVLCYHQIRDFRASDSKRSRDYIVPPERFMEQMKLLKDSGYTSVLPDQLIHYLLTGAGLPEKPVLLSFDDADLSQFEKAKPVLDQYGFKGVFFIMTVVLNKPGYMSREQVRQLSQEGHVVGSHTWDHMNMKKLTPEDWAVQVDKPSRQLSEITGKPVEYFAYPFGLWDTTAAAGIKARGFRAAFQLSAKRDSVMPLYTIRRIIVPGEWPTDRVYKFMRQGFR